MVAQRGNVNADGYSLLPVPVHAAYPNYKKLNAPRKLNVVW